MKKLSLLVLGFCLFLSSNVLAWVETNLNLYVPLAGGTMTGGLNGTTANFSGPITASSITANGDILLKDTFGIRVKNSADIGRIFTFGTDDKFYLGDLDGVATNLTIRGGGGGDAINIDATAITMSVQTTLTLNTKTAAQLKALAPTIAGIPYYDSTNKAVVISTGTGIGAFGLITNGTALPTGW